MTVDTDQKIAALERSYQQLYEALQQVEQRVKNAAQGYHALNEDVAETRGQLQVMHEQLAALAFATNTKLQEQQQTEQAKDPTKVIQTRGGWQALYKLPDGGAVSVMFSDGRYSALVRPRSGKRVQLEPHIEV